ncbi:MAG TPA: histidine phosphatase family protein [Chloroflexota bacterium]|jgi:broad specificity phosphatase PhoE
MNRVILVRHGATEWNESGRLQGHGDVPLSSLGQQQAQQLAKRLQREPITSAFASDLMRARQTAETILAGRDLPLRISRRLREMAFGAWEGLTSEEIEKGFTTEWHRWIGDPLRIAPPGGESLTQLRRRVLAFYRSLTGPRASSLEGPSADTPTAQMGDETSNGTRKTRNARPIGRRRDGPMDTILIVAHGGPLRALLTHLLTMPVEGYWRFQVRAASVSIFDVYPEGAIADVIGDTSHLNGTATH